MEIQSTSSSFFHAIVEVDVAQIKPIIPHLCYKYSERYVCLVLYMSLGRQRRARIKSSIGFPQRWKLFHTFIHLAKETKFLMLHQNKFSALEFTIKPGRFCTKTCMLLMLHLHRYLLSLIMKLSLVILYPTS